MNRSITLYIAAILLCTVTISVWLASCSNTLTDSRDLVFPETGVSYGKYVQVYFDLSCAFSGCHSKDNPAQGLSFASYFDFIGRAGLVVPGKPDQSVLIQVIDTSNARSKFHPLNFQTRITANQIRGIRTWVKEGALLN